MVLISAAKIIHQTAKTSQYLQKNARTVHFFYDTQLMKMGVWSAAPWYEIHSVGECADIKDREFYVRFAHSRSALTPKNIHWIVTWCPNISYIAEFTFSSYITLSMPACVLLLNGSRAIVGLPSVDGQATCTPLH